MTSSVTSVTTSDCPCPPQRQFQDKSYFLGALRTKMTELTSEVARLGREVETQTREQSTYLAYDKRVKELAEDVTSYQVISESFIVSH